MDEDRRQLARICRRQATLASSREVRRTLIELAEHYETAALDASVPQAREGPGEKLE
jgi:hypothetical protein